MNEVSDGDPGGSTRFPTYC